MLLRYARCVCEKRFYRTKTAMATAEYARTHSPMVPIRNSWSSFATAFTENKRAFTFRQFRNVQRERSTYNAGFAPGTCIGCVLAPGVNNSLVCCCIFISLSISRYCCSSAYANAHGTPSNNALVPITHNALPPHNNPVLA